MVDGDDASTEAAQFWRYISSSLDELFAIVRDERAEVLLWRPPAWDSNSILVIAQHALANACVNILGTLGGEAYEYDREANLTTTPVQDDLLAEWAAAHGRLEQVTLGASQERLNGLVHHRWRGDIAGREVLIIVARHAAEHLAQARLTADLAVLVALGDDPGSAAYYRWVNLPEWAKTGVTTGAYDRATAYAEELLALAPGYEDDWNYGNAIHRAHLTLGEVALARGEVEEAVMRLLLAGSVPGSPQLDSFGPNMRLAKALLRAGITEPVLAYFELCRFFWECERGQLTKWRADVLAGRIPDFGGNLEY
ncbi:MAG: hypothetical protein ACKVVT_15700 [Dehalococcoidia bacterium]